MSRESEYQIYTVLIRIFRLPGPRGQASLISCCQLLASRLASATSGGSPTSVTRCEPYLYQCCPHWTCCYPVFNFFRTEAAPSSSRTSWCSPSSASPPSSSSSWLNTIQISKPTYHPLCPHCHPHDIWSDWSGQTISVIVDSYWSDWSIFCDGTCSGLQTHLPRFQGFQPFPVGLLIPSTIC